MPARRLVGKVGVYGSLTLNQPVLEDPDRGPIRDLAAVTQSDKTLGTEAVKQLKLHLFIAQIEELLNQQHAYHEFGGK